MLQVTDSAVAVFKQILESDEVEGTAIRLAPAPSPTGDTTITIQAVTEPEEGDQAGQATGLEVFVASDLAAPLSRAVLDTTETDQGIDLVLRPQAPAS